MGKISARFLTKPRRDYFPFELYNIHYTINIQQYFEIFLIHIIIYLPKYCFVQCLSTALKFEITLAIAVFDVRISRWEITADIAKEASSVHSFIHCSVYNIQNICNMHDACINYFKLYLTAQ